MHRDAWRYRTVWISDLHLGTPGCQAEGLLEFLKRVECETLFLVGDIVDAYARFDAAGGSGEGPERPARRGRPR